MIRSLPEGLSEIYLHPATGPYSGAAPGYRYREEFAGAQVPGGHRGESRYFAAAWRIQRFPGFAGGIAPGRGAGAISNGGSAAVNSPMSAISESSAAQESFPDGPIRRGSEAHKILFCRTLLDTFNPYKPAVIDWPALDEEARNRLVSLPIWDIAVQTEGRARTNVATYAATASDPLLRKAIELNAFEEGRHKLVLSNLVAAYGIAACARTAIRREGRPGVGLHGHRVQRVHRQLFRLRSFRIGQAFRILSGSAGRYLRAGHS